MLVLSRAIGADTIYYYALAILSSYDLSEATRRELTTALDVGRPGNLQFSYEAGMEAGLHGKELLQRAAALYFLACAVNVADDLSDGDCTYLADSERSG